MSSSASTVVVTPSQSLSDVSMRSPSTEYSSGGDVIMRSSRRGERRRHNSRILRRQRANGHDSARSANISVRRTLFQ